MTSCFYNNVFFDPASNRSFDELLEKDYLQKTFDQLYSLMGETFKDYQFYIFSDWNSNSIPASAQINSDRKILFHLSNENTASPNHLSTYYNLIFKTYLADKNVETNIFPMPLGYAGKDYNLPQIDINSRKHSVFYSGNLNRNRIPLLYEMSGLRHFVPKKRFLSGKYFYWVFKYLSRFNLNYNHLFRNSYLKFTGNFLGGLDSKAYNEILADSKISLCPTGFEVNETYRHYESMKAGCIVISLDKPNSIYLQNAPILSVKNWREGLDIIKEILSDRDKMEKLSIETLDYYHKYCSEKAFSTIVWSRIKNDKKQILLSAIRKTKQVGSSLH